MQALLIRHGFRAIEDEDVRTIGHALSPALGDATRTVKHLRIVTVERTGSV